MFIVDAHLDLAHVAVDLGRDLRQPLSDLRAVVDDQDPYGRPIVTLPELRAGAVGIVWGTIFAQPATYNPDRAPQHLLYHNAEEAHRLGMAHIDYYHRLADEVDWVHLVTDRAALAAVRAAHEAGEEPGLGIMPLMEGADPIRRPEELEMWYERGLRAVGLAWHDTRYAAGAWRGRGRGLTEAGRRLLAAMADMQVILDLTHMSETAALEALDLYDGPVVATHANARRLVPGERQLSDDQIRRLAERDGVVGVVLLNSFLRAGHKMGDPKELVSLDHVVAHIDYVCQLLGDAEHVGLGSDFDGGFGAADIPAEMDRASDLGLLPGRLGEAGYGAGDIDNIMGGNWLRVLEEALP